MTLAVVVASLALAGSPAEDASPGTVAGPPAPAAASAAPRRSARPARPLKLGPYGALSEPVTPADLGETPRFETHVEVHGRAMDSATLTARLDWWLRDSDLTRGATPASMSAPSLQEMREYRPHPPDAVNVLPIVQWLAEKLGKK
jgi:hypothetical protein